mmetsp:Transcript_19934/g.64708  ORF Transcript_19934/g.64708 Transcript_19934/m.64708 type:complete len:223 (-) Transcript_19934:627-1295(-)
MPSFSRWPRRGIRQTTGCARLNTSFSMTCPRRMLQAHWRRRQRRNCKASGRRPTRLRMRRCGRAPTSGTPTPAASALCRSRAFRRCTSATRLNSAWQLRWTPCCKRPETSFTPWPTIVKPPSRSGCVTTPRVSCSSPTVSSNSPRPSRLIACCGRCRLAGHTGSPPSVSPSRLGWRSCRTWPPPFGSQGRGGPGCTSSGRRSTCRPPRRGRSPQPRRAVRRG